MDNYTQDRKCRALEKASLDHERRDPIVLPFSLLKAITKGFSDNQLIGRGGFAAVYKGVLPNGTVIAVKKLLDNIEVLDDNFESEVACLIEANHKNIVQFLGYCSETQHQRTPYVGHHVWADVRQRLLCFEYLSKGNLAKHLTGPSSGLQWSVRYQIIKGICEGVGYLHQNRIIHRDLKPQNILLDDNMIPKIADFGTSRCFSENQSRAITGKVIGSWGYMAPEFISTGTITLKTDIFSLGVIIIEVLMGCRECPSVDKVLESWANTSEISESHTILEQVKVCAEIWRNCINFDPNERPDIQVIIHSLDAMNISDSIISDASTSSAAQLVDVLKSMTSALSQEQSALDRFYQHYRLAKKACKPMQISASIELCPGSSDQSELLDVHPLELCFPFEAKKQIHCLLNLINKTDRHVACWIIPQFPDIYTPIERFNRITLGPMSTGTLNVTMLKQRKLPLDAGMFEILMIPMGSDSNSDSDVEDLVSSIGWDPKIDGNLVERVQAMDGEVYAAIVTAVVCAPSEMVNCQQSTDDGSVIVSRAKFTDMRTTDVHPTQPWILVGHSKYVSIWDYEKKASVVSLDVEEEEQGKCTKTSVQSTRFVPLRQWLVAGDDWGYIHVYDYSTTTSSRLKKLKRFRAEDSRVVSLAIHPTCPYLLSACEDGVISLWDWDNDWTCSRQVNLFSDKHPIPTLGCAIVKFNPNDANTFTSRDTNGGLKVWSIDNSPAGTTSITTIQQSSSEIYDHVFTKAGGNQVVIVTEDGLSIWDLQTGTHVHTLCATGCFDTAVACHPTMPLIAAAVKQASDCNGSQVIRFWNSNTYRLEKTVSCTSVDWIQYLAFVGSRRLVIGTDYEGIEILEIDMESLVSHQCA